MARFPVPKCAITWRITFFAVRQQGAAALCGLFDVAQGLVQRIEPDAVARAGPACQFGQPLDCRLSAAEVADQVVPRRRSDIVAERQPESRQPFVIACRRRARACAGGTGHVPALEPMRLSLPRSRRDMLPRWVAKTIIDMATSAIVRRGSWVKAEYTGTAIDAASAASDEYRDR